MKTPSIYKSPEGEKAIMEFYDKVLKRWPVPYEGLNIPTRHGNTFIIASGEEFAPALVLLHGAASNSSMWVGDVAEYSREFRVYAVDIPGEPGKSTPNRLDWHSYAYAEWLEDVFDTLKIKEANLIGYSQGGWTALRFSTHKPERVEKLVLTAPGGIAPPPLPFILKAIPLSLLGRWGTEGIKRMVYGKQAIHPEADKYYTLIVNNFKSRIGKPYIFSDEELKRLTMPTLLITGAEDALCDSEKTIARMRTLLPNFSNINFPGVGHLLLNITGAILPFLAVEGLHEAHLRT